MKCPECQSMMVEEHIVNGRGIEGHRCLRDNLCLTLYESVCQKRGHSFFFYDSHVKTCYYCGHKVREEQYE